MIRTHFEDALDFEIKCLEEALYLMEENDHAMSRDYAILAKKLRVVKATAKKINKLSKKRQKLLKNSLQHSENLI